MTIYKATIRVTREVEIVVHARDADEARRYLQSNDEWQEDASFDVACYSPEAAGQSFEVVAVEKIEHPSESPWEGDCRAWNGWWTDIGDGPTTVAEAFFGPVAANAIPKSDGWWYRDHTKAVPDVGPYATLDDLERAHPDIADADKLEDPFFARDLVAEFEEARLSDPSRK